MHRGKGTKLRLVCFCFCFCFWFLYGGNIFIKRKNTTQRMKTINRGSNFFLKKEPKKKKNHRQNHNTWIRKHTYLFEIYTQALHKFLISH